MDSTVLLDGLPTSLADLLSNTLILRQTAPYLPVSSLCALAATSRPLYYTIRQSPEAFRYLDLSPVKSAIVPFDGPLDAGGIVWRAERMDESLSEDEFYSGPLRGIFSRLEKQSLLRNVHTLVLDGLSVTAELVKDLLTEERYNVRILSIREVKHLNERKLQQYLRYAVRPSRPEGTPRVKGIYLFGPRDPAPLPGSSSTNNPPSSVSRGIMSSQGAQIGAEWNQKSSEALGAALARTEDKWYQSSGKMMTKRPSSEWAEVIQACEGIVAFDAVLCRGPRHDPSKAYVTEGQSHSIPHPASFLRPCIATVALGPSGCESCHTSSEGPAACGHSPSSHLPLLSPVPLHGSSIRAAQTPHTIDGSTAPPLYVRCEDCLKGRWCERCNKWWDEECYAGSTVAQRTELQQTELTEDIQSNGSTCLIPKQTIKIIGVRRDCFGCGHTCISCKELFIRQCTKCQQEYCREDNETSSETLCDWCNYTARRSRVS
ncbi:hypothetical protein P153DRAFT_307749 [Dothidotthia symphoricarpi CBS 119687]|uniref:Uncharacterized protein n=1 Tax=Dothidotthia symphoricarpi CBS 119687 TaxID=1392245 RepID=A0A6A6AMI4_9PLEO|nr:uncharacterized protein P153DRAFT_307749 [Dothidotthia symphoricarpi CBS 119687]KAF2133192.1 hypothetical protein P153DRAFT_307749 [Dothidotthia symphoricarpi CBS 119687]